MDADDCRKERLSSRTVGFFLLILSVLLLTAGLLILPVIGFVFAIPLLLLGVTMIAAPESKVCQMIRQRLKVK